MKTRKEKLAEKLTKVPKEPGDVRGAKRFRAGCAQRMRAGSCRLRRRLCAWERRAEEILTMNTDFHSRLRNYRNALTAGMNPMPVAW